MAAIACSAMGHPVLAQPTVIDDFNDPVLDFNWVETLHEFVGPNEVMMNYDTTTNPGKLTYSYHGATSNNARQLLLARNDFGLMNDGDMLQVTVGMEHSGGTVNNLFAGIMVDATHIPFDTLAMFAILLRGDGNVRIQNFGSNVVNVSTGVDPSATDFVLRIVRESSFTATGWYSVNGGSTFEQIGTEAFAVNGFDAVGVLSGNGRLSPESASFLYDDLMIGPVPASLAGDFNSDGVVDAADYTWWRDYDGQPSNYLIWKENFGSSHSGGGAAFAVQVPEPTGVGLLVTLGLIACPRRTRRRHGPANKLWESKARE